MPSCGEDPNSHLSNSHIALRTQQFTVVSWLEEMDLMQGLSVIKHYVDIMIISETEEQIGTDLSQG